MLAAPATSTASTSSVSAPLSNKHFTDRRRVGGKKKHLLRRLAQDGGLDFECEETSAGLRSVGSSKKRDGSDDNTPYNSVPQHMPPSITPVENLSHPSILPAVIHTLSGGSNSHTFRKCPDSGTAIDRYRGFYEEESSFTASSSGGIGRGGYFVATPPGKIRKTSSEEKVGRKICEPTSLCDGEPASDDISFTSESDGDLEVLEEGNLKTDCGNHTMDPQMPSEFDSDEEEKCKCLSSIKSKPGDPPVKKLRLILRLGKTHQDELEKKEKNWSKMKKSDDRNKEEEKNNISSRSDKPQECLDYSEDSDSEFNRSLREVEREVEGIKTISKISHLSEQCIKDKSTTLAYDKKSIMNGVLLQQGVARLHNRDTSENISSEEEEWTDDDDSSLPQDAIKLSKKVPYSSSLSSEVSSKFGGEKLVINNNSKDNELEYSSDHGWLEEAEAAEYAKQKKKKKRKKKRKNKRRSRNKSQTGCPRPIFSQLSNSTATVMKKEEGEIPNLTISSVESEKKVPKIHVHIPPCRKNSVENSSSSEEEWDDSCENDNSSMASASSHLYHISYSPLSDVMSTPASSLLCVEDNTLRPYGIVLALSTSATLVVYPQTHHPSNIPRFEDEIQRVHRDERVILKIGRGQMVLFDGGLIHGGRGRGPAFPGAEFGIGPVAPIIPDEGPCVRAHFYLEPAQRKGVGQFGNPAAAVVGAPDLKGGAGVEFMNGTLPLDAAIPSYSRNRGGDVEQRQLHREVNMRGDQVIATCKNKECKKCALGAVNRFHTRYGAYTIVDSNDPGEFMVDCSQMHSRNGRPGYVAGDLRSEGWAVFDTCKKMIVTEEDLQQIPKNAWDKIFNEEKEFNYAVDRVKPPPSKFTLPSSPSHSTSTATEIIPKLVRPGRRMMCKLNPCLNHHVTKKRGRKLLDIQKHVERHIGDLGFNEYEMVVNDASLLMTEKWTADQRPHRDFSRYLLHGEG